MKLLVYQGPGQKDWIEKPMPEIQEQTDVIVRITKTTICGTDLHVLKSDVPAVTPGRTLGHEGVGVVEAVGAAVQNFKPGDTIAIIGAGPVGMSVLLTAQFYWPGRIVMIDMDPARRELAKKFGATDTIQVGTADPVAQIMEMTGGRGDDRERGGGAGREP